MQENFMKKKKMNYGTETPKCNFLPLRCMSFDWKMWQMKFNKSTKLPYNFRLHGKSLYYLHHIISEKSMSATPNSFPKMQAVLFILICRRCCSLKLMFVVTLIWLYSWYFVYFWIAETLLHCWWRECHWQCGLISALLKWSKL